MKKAVLYVVDNTIYHFCVLMGPVPALISAPAYRASNPELVVYNS
jgi:hypothetical protein